LTLLEQRKQALLLKKRKKEAVLLIEKERYLQLHRRECRLLRKYLAKLPYRCRGLYFKFVDVKKNTHLLVDEFASFMADTHSVRETETFKFRYN
jgi:hypothetical protein